MKPVPIFKDHTGRWREVNPHPYISEGAEYLKYAQFEQSIAYHEFPNAPEVKPGEVVMAYLQWQMKSRGTNEWNLFPAKYKTEYISSYNTYMLNGWIYDCRQIWVLAPSPEASRGNDVRGKEEEKELLYKKNFLIALFMGAEKDGGSTMALDGTYAESYRIEPWKYNEVTFHDKLTHIGIHSIAGLEYHQSWDWIIPVVIKIRAFDKIKIGLTPSEAEKIKKAIGSIINRIDAHLLEPNISNLHSACYDFIHFTNNIFKP